MLHARCQRGDDNNLLHPTRVTMNEEIAILSSKKNKEKGRRKKAAKGVLTGLSNTTHATPSVHAIRSIVRLYDLQLHLSNCLSQTCTSSTLIWKITCACVIWLPLRCKIKYHLVPVSLILHQKRLKVTTDNKKWYFFFELLFLPSKSPWNLPHAFTFPCHLIPNCT